MIEHFLMLENLLLPTMQQVSSSNVFSVIQKTFVERGDSYSGLESTLIVLLVIIVIISMIIAFLTYRNSKRKYIPHDWVIDPKDLINIFEISIDQRSRYEINFSIDGGGRKPGVVTSLHSIGSGVLNFECTDIKNLSSSWIHRDAEVYFKVKTDEKKYSFYSFRSVVEGIRKVRDNTWMLSFKIPYNLEARQKRNFLRITPTAEFVMGIAVWPTDPLTGALPNDIRLCGRPHLALVPGRVAQLELKDVSAGGGRLVIPREDAKNSGFEFNIGDRLVLLLDLLEPEENNRLRLLFHCKVQSPFLDFEKSSIEIGIQFLEWGKIKESTSSELEWFRVAKGGEVEPLGNWIMRRHLEAYRDQPLTDID